MQIVHALAYTLVALWLITGAGNALCRSLFVLTGLGKAEAAVTVRPAGWLIGWLERLLLAIGMLAHSWEVLVAVVALKTVARFKELDDQEFAEQFLVGSLFSVLWAIVVTSAWLAYDGRLGMDLHGMVAGLMVAAGGGLD